MACCQRLVGTAAGTGDIPPEDDRLVRATRISRLVQDFSKLDDDARREAVEALLGAGAYDSLKSQRDAVLAIDDRSQPRAHRRAPRSMPGKRCSAA